MRIESWIPCRCRSIHYCGGAINVASGTLELDGGGSIGGTNTGIVLLNNGAWTTAGALTLLNDGTATGLVVASGITLTNTGSLTDLGKLRLGTVSNSTAVATLVNAAWAVLNLASANAQIGGMGASLVSNSGTILDTATAATSIGSPLTNNGLVDVGAGAALKITSLNGTGTLQIEGGGLLEFGTGVSLANANTIVFKGIGDTLRIDKLGSMANAMTGAAASCGRSACLPLSISLDLRHHLAAGLCDVSCGGQALRPKAKPTSALAIGADAKVSDEPPRLPRSHTRSWLLEL